MSQHAVNAKFCLFPVLHNDQHHGCHSWREHIFVEAWIAPGRGDNVSVGDLVKLRHIVLNLSVEFCQMRPHLAHLLLEQGQSLLLALGKFSSHFSSIFETANLSWRKSSAL